ncbi:MAG: S53 family peptidase [Caulobacteraceae bacterium]
MRKIHYATLPLCAALGLASLAHAATPRNAQVAALAPSAPVDFEIFLPLRNETTLDSLLAAQQTPTSPSYRHWLTPAQFAAQFGPSAQSMANVRDAMTAAGLQVTATHSRSLHVAGTAAQVGKAFQTTLNTVTQPGGAPHIVAATAMTAPAALRAEGVVIPAFTGIPDRQPHSRKLGLAPNNRNGAFGAYNYDDMKQAYDYPSYQTILPGGQRLDGTGVHVAVLMETDALDSDIAAMFNHENFTATTGLQPPTIEHFPVDGGAPFNPNSGGSFEASLDVQQVLGGAPGASVTLVSLPDLSDAHIIDGYVAIVDANRWDMVNSSFGGCELNYTKAYNNGVDYTGVLKVYDEVFKQGNAQGITFVASSGDSGGLSCPSVDYFSGSPNAHFVVAVQTPSDDPNVTAVGGGNLETTPPALPSLTSQYVSENTNGDKEIPYDIYGLGVNVSGGYWGAGGGRSVVFKQPAYQNAFGMSVPGRAIPDVGMQVGGCPLGLAKTPCHPGDSAAIVTLAGLRYGVIGTSVSSPEFVGALVLYSEMSGKRLGNINRFLWEKGAVQDDFGGGGAPQVAHFFHKNIPGFDGAYSHASTSGYDYLVGNGTPKVRTLFGMRGFAPAGDPQTISNP